MLGAGRGEASVGSPPSSSAIFSAASEQVAELQTDELGGGEGEASAATFAGGSSAISSSVSDHVAECRAEVLEGGSAISGDRC